MASERLLAARTAAPTTEQAATGMSCVVSRCGSALEECVRDPTCLRGLGCFVACSANPSSSGTSAATVGEGACQVRCVDLYESDKLNAFTRCTLTENGCYPALAADPRYPPLPSHLAITTDEAQLRHLLTGRWYVSAGLNPAFDTFACQVHDFTAADETDKPSRSEGTTTVPIADATFSYRVALDSKGHKSVTRVGQKRLYLKRGGGTDMSGATPMQFRRGRAWGRDSFDPPSPVDAAERMINEKKSGAQLALTTVPDYMNYEDEWTILSASSIDDSVGSVGSGLPKSGPSNRGSAQTAERAAPASPVPSSSFSLSPSQPSTDYMVVAYRGSNSAWRGYGGLNVYTRRPVDLSDLTMRQQQHLRSSSSTTNPDGDAALLQGIQRGLDKVGLTVADLLPVDHASGYDRAGDGPGGTN